MRDLFTTPAEPPLPPGYLEQTMVLARRAHRRDRQVRLAVATLVVLVFALAGSFVPGRMTAGPALGPTGLILPDRIEGYRWLTAEVSRSPGGAALMLFTSGSNVSVYTYQALALGADGRTYRDVEAMRDEDGRHTRRGMLSPDGKSLLIAERKAASSALWHVDLETGATRQIKLARQAGVWLHAWSPDGQFAAFGQTPWPGSGAELEQAIFEKGTASILDLKTGEVTSLAHFGPVSAVAFAPGSRQMALQAGRKLIVADVDGTRPREVGLPDSGMGIVPGVAWSPDGRLIAIMRWNPLPVPGKVAFVDSTGGGSRTVPGPYFGTGTMLGWRSPRGIAEFDPASGVIAEVALDEPHQRTVLTTMEHPRTCEFWTEQCRLSDVTVATELLMSAQSQPAPAPLRGPWPPWLELTSAAGAGLLGLLLFLLWRRMRPSGLPVNHQLS